MSANNLVMRSYEPRDRHRILEIFRSNCPKYFQFGDEASLAEFLDQFADLNFLVVESRGSVIGCGGHYVRHDKRVIGIAWVMFERRALGPKAFLDVADRFFDEIMSRIRLAKTEYDIVINTTQVMEHFFQRYGFFQRERTPGGFGEGLDHVVMVRPVE